MFTIIVRAKVNVDVVPVSSYQAEAVVVVRPPLWMAELRKTSTGLCSMVICPPRTSTSDEPTVVPTPKLVRVAEDAFTYELVTSCARAGTAARTKRAAMRIHSAPINPQLNVAVAVSIVVAAVGNVGDHLHRDRV